VKLFYITIMFPFGTKEAFFTPEVQELIRCGHDVTILPIRNPGGIVHADAEALRPVTVFVPPLGAEVAWALMSEFVANPVRTFRAALRLLGHSRNPAIAARNMAVFPKGVWAGREALRRKVEHIHAQWAGTTASIGWVASTISGIAFSFTAHRWDIPHDNALALKAEAASVIRTIDEPGAAELSLLVGPHDRKIQVIHMGVVPREIRCHALPSLQELRVVVVANLVEKKGHQYLILAARMLVDRGMRLKIDFVGDGPLRDDLQRQVINARLDGLVRFVGVLPHDEIMRRLLDSHWDVMALPSIVTDSGEKEGIPVSLIEAMACGVPVISTQTGGIPELLGEGAGVLVPERDPAALAQELERLFMDSERRRRLAIAGARRVSEQFSVSAVMRRFVASISENV
jgi:colanic acid/amylovoran biosynthesis glycosyltransferase